MVRLYGRRVLLRPLTVQDFASYSEVRRRNAAWLTRWEPRRPPGAADPAVDRESYLLRCSARDRERQLGNGYSFGIFVDGAFGGEINLNAIQRGPMQSAYVGYWIDEQRAGRSYMPEAVAVVCRFAFEELRLHRLQINIIPRNANSRRVMEKLRFREEGVAVRYLEIDGVWEDHVRYAITAEEWLARRDDLVAAWISPASS
ncbi:MAG: GNAT family N-acetyltransferase [Acidimicrobiales bacterium]